MSNPTSNSTSTSNPAWQSFVGAALAILSGFFLGTSVVLRKRGLIEIAAEGHDVTSGSRAYLKNKFWWLGMLLQAVGEVANFGAYAFCPTILVTPMGTLAIVFNAILSSYLLNESLAFLGIMGCGLCMVGVILIVIHAIQASDPETVMDFVSYVIQPGFLVYSVFIVVLVLWLKYYAEPRWAKQTPFVYIAMSSCGGAYLVLSAQGVGSAIVYSARNWTSDNQFWQWPLYPLILFMLLAVIYQITYLNKALAVNPSAVIYPISFVCFNGMTIITTSILFQEFPVDTVSAGISVAAGLFVIVMGVILLSVSKNETQDIEVTDKIGVTRVLSIRKSKQVAHFRGDSLATLNGDPLAEVKAHTVKRKIDPVTEEPNILRTISTSVSEAPITHQTELSTEPDFHMWKPRILAPVSDNDQPTLNRLTSVGRHSSTSGRFSVPARRLSMKIEQGIQSDESKEMVERAYETRFVSIGNLVV